MFFQPITFLLQSEPWPSQQRWSQPQIWLAPPFSWIWSVQPIQERWWSAQQIYAEWERYNDDGQLFPFFRGPQDNEFFTCFGSLGPGLREKRFVTYLLNGHLGCSGWSFATEEVREMWLGKFLLLHPSLSLDTRFCMLASFRMHSFFNNII